MADPIWDHRSEEHRHVFLALLAPLILASRTRDFHDSARANDQAIAWILALPEIPYPVLEAGRDRLLRRVLPFMPRPGDLRQACAEVVDEQRARIGQEVAAAKAQCELRRDGRCVSDFVEIDGKMQRCDCHVRGLQRLQQVAAPVERLALPAAESEAI